MNRTRLKYYLRALGIGIIVTALLMGYSQEPPQMSDEEILRRAAELEQEGQREVLADLATATPEPERSPEPGAAISEESAVSPAPGSTEKPVASPTPRPTEEPVASSTPKPAEEPAVSSTSKPAEESTVSSASAGDVTILIISRGESSMAVSRNLQELGLVEDYGGFDRFLCDNGYDHSIITGTHEIPLGATYEEIAGIICKIR